jgi:hypothetical protein
MGYAATLRATQAAERRQQRDAQKRFRDLERQAKEQAKLSAIEQARLEVETFENQLEVLLSVHKEQGETWDWAGIAASLPPPCPQKSSRNEQKARQCLAVLIAPEEEILQSRIEQARVQDAQEYETAARIYSEQMAEWEKFKDLACRILAGEHKAFTEVLVDVSPFAEISNLGSAIHFTVHTAKLLQCELKVKGKKVIPAEVKTLTSSGKLAVKAMPKGRFHEIYQNYLCGCVLRVGRELFALFPAEIVLITATADSHDSRTGRATEQPVLSVVIPRVTLERLDFGELDPSDAMENFQHRGELKVSRKAEAFQPIAALTVEDITTTATADLNISELLVNVQKAREHFRAEIARLDQRAGASITQTSTAL